MEREDRYTPAFAVVPLDVLRAPELSRRELQVLGVLYAYARGKAQGWPSRETLAALLNIDRSNVRHALRNLERKGFITSTPGRGAGNLTAYNLTHHPHTESEGKGVANNPFQPEKKGWNRAAKGVISTAKRGRNDSKKGSPRTPERNKGTRKEHEGNTPLPPTPAKSATDTPGQSPLPSAPLTGAPSGSRPKPFDGYPAAFEILWEARPRRAGSDPKPAAFRAWQARIREGRITTEDAHAAVLRYAEFCRATGKIETEIVQQLATFFGLVKEGYLQDWAPPRSPGPPGESGRFTGLLAKDYGVTKPGLFTGTPEDGPAGDGQANSKGNPGGLPDSWRHGTYAGAGFLADALDGDQDGELDHG